MKSELPRSAARASEKAAWLGLVSVIVCACGTDEADGGSTHRADWVRTFIGSEQIASSVATDAEGNIYVGGLFADGAVEFGSGQLDCPFEAGAPRWCGFLLKLDPMGNTLWSRAFVASNTLSIDVSALGVLEDGVVMAASWRRYQIRHAPLDVGTGPLDPPGDYPMVLAKFDPSGTPLWSAAFGDDVGEVVPAALVVDGPSSFTVGGGFSTASLDLGAGPMAFTGPKPFINKHTIFLSHFDGTTVGWQKSFGGNTSQELAGFGRGPTGDLLLAGYFQEALDFGGPPLTTTESSAVFQATLDASGGFVADQRFDATGSFLSATGVAADAAGSTLVTGTFDGTLKIGATPLVCQGDFNGYLAKIDAQGKVIFTEKSTEQTTALDGFFSVAADASNNVLWGAELLFVNASGDYLEGRIKKLDPNGATLWSVVSENFGPRAFAFDADENIIAVGEFSSKIDFAKGDPILATQGTNAFIAKFSP
jgi:hypothetical protein